MKAFEFQTSLQPDRRVVVPQDIAAQIPQNAAVRIMVILDEQDDRAEELAWLRFGNEQFLKGDNEADAIYDNL